MGEIAQDYVVGACCLACAAYFATPHGYPVLCGPCWRQAGEQHPTAQRATHRRVPGTIRG